MFWENAKLFRGGFSQEKASAEIRGEFFRTNSGWICRGFFAGMFWPFSSEKTARKNPPNGKKQQEKIHPKIHGKFKSECGSFATKPTLQESALEIFPFLSKGLFWGFGGRKDSCLWFCLEATKKQGQEDHGTGWPKNRIWTGKTPPPRISPTSFSIYGANKTHKEIQHKEFWAPKEPPPPKKIVYVWAFSCILKGKEAPNIKNLWGQGSLGGGGGGLGGGFLVQNCLCLCLLSGPDYFQLKTDVSPPASGCQDCLFWLSQLCFWTLFFLGWGWGGVGTRRDIFKTLNQQRAK